MKKYFATLHQKPERHKKRFALLVSGTTTLLIFALWCLVTFGVKGTLAQDFSTNSQTNRSQDLEVGPLESLRQGLASSVEGWSQILETMKTGLGMVVGLEADYSENKNGILTNYVE